MENQIIYKRFKEDLSKSYKPSTIESVGNFIQRTEGQGYFKPDTALSTLIAAGTLETPTTIYTIYERSTLEIWIESGIALFGEQYLFTCLDKDNKLQQNVGFTIFNPATQERLFYSQQPGSWFIEYDFMKKYKYKEYKEYCWEINPNIMLLQSLYCFQIRAVHTLYVRSALKPYGACFVLKAKYKLPDNLALADYLKLTQLDNWGAGDYWRAGFYENQFEENIIDKKNINLKKASKNGNKKL